MVSEKALMVEGEEAKLAFPDIRKTGIHPDFWYPVARSKEVRRGKAQAVAFAGEPIVLIRTEGGELYALEDRCAHRQIPLHRGVVEKDAIKCAYHGWKFDRTGRCVGVPYMEKCSLRPKNVRAYPCREAYGLVFVYPGDIGKLESVEFPQIPSATDPEYKVRYLDRLVRCHFSFMHENLMDMNHQFLHRRFMGGIKTTLLEVREGESWVEADYTFSRVAGKQPLGERFIIGKTEQGEKKRPDIMTIRTGYPYQTLKFQSGGSAHPALDLWNAYVPRDQAQKTNHTYGLMMIRRPSIPGLLEVIWPFIIWFTNQIFAEDREICELEQSAFDSQGADWNHEIFPVIRALRRVLTSNSVARED